MARYTVTARTYVSLNGASQANAEWGLELRTSGAGAGGMRIMDVYAQNRAGWTLLGGVSFYPDYSGVITFGKGEQIGRSMALATIPRGNPLSQLEVTSRVTIGTGDFVIEGSARGDYWKSTRGGHDSILGLGGHDTLFGGAGNDTFWIDNRADRVVELAGGGIDRIYASIGIDLARTSGAYAHVENVRLLGTAALNAYGAAGDNVLVGNAGANILAGRAGNDVLAGGAGADTFVFGKGYEADRISDFQDGLDRIRLQAFDDVKTVGQARAHATQVGADVVFDFGDGDRLTVQNARLDAVLDDLIFL